MVQLQSTHAGQGLADSMHVLQHKAQYHPSSLYRVGATCSHTTRAVLLSYPDQAKLTGRITCSFSYHLTVESV